MDVSGGLSGRPQPRVGGFRLLEDALDGFARAFALGDLDGVMTFMAEDARLLPHERADIVGRRAIEEEFRGVFAAVDTANFAIRYDVVQVQGDAASVLAAFSETLRPRDGGSPLEVDGRIVYFWRFSAKWELTRILVARASPDRQL